MNSFLVACQSQSGSEKERELNCTSAHSQDITREKRQIFPFSSAKKKKKNPIFFMGSFPPFLHSHVPQFLLADGRLPSLLGKLRHVASIVVRRSAKLAGFPQWELDASDAGVARSVCASVSDKLIL